MTSIINPATTTATVTGDIAIFTPPDYTGSATYPGCALQLEVTYPDGTLTTHTPTTPLDLTLTQEGTHSYRWSLDA